MILDYLRNFLSIKLKKPIQRTVKGLQIPGQSAQVLFTTDIELKTQVLEKAKRQGITLKALFVFCMKAYLDGKIHVSVIGSHKLPISRARKILKTEEEQVQQDAERLVKSLKRSYLCQPRDTL